MASGERRPGTSRRGMTVLGKIPMPSVPKPINLPSQRSENRGLDPNVEIVPRGTFSWGNAGTINAAASGVTSSSATSPGALNGGIKSLTSGIDVGSPSGNPLSSGYGTRPLSAPTIATTTAWGGSAKTQVHVQVPSSGVPMESVTPGSKENLPQHNEILFNRPAAPDGTVRNMDLHPLPGVSANAGAFPCHVPCHEGLQNPGDDRRTSARQGMPPAGIVGMASYSCSLPHEVGLQSVGAPHYSGPRNKVMMLAQMVDNPSLYENYQPHLTPVACSGQSGVYGSYLSQTRNVEQFAKYGNHAAAGSSGTTDRRTDLFTVCNNFERGGLCDSGQGFHMYRDGQLGTEPKDQGYCGLYSDVDTYDMVPMSTQKNERDHTIPGYLRSHNHVNEAVDFVKHEVALFSKQMPEKKVTLLTKAPRVEAQKTENSINNSTSLPDCDKRSVSCGQELGCSKQLEVKDESSDNNIFSKVKRGKITDEIFESKEERLEVKTGINKLSSAGLPSSMLTSTTSNENVKNVRSNSPSKHDGKADAEDRRGKSARQTRKVTIQGGLEPVGDDVQPVCSVPMKQMITEDVTRRYNQKLQTKALNHKTEKAWRPKSPVFDSVLTPGASSSLTAGDERVNGKNCDKVTDRDESSQEDSTGDIVSFEAATSWQKRKARKWKNIHCLSNLVSEMSSKEEDPSLSVALNLQQPEIVGCAIDQHTEYKNERDTASHACSTTFSVKGLNAEDCNFMETDKLSQRKAKGRPSYHKADKEWRLISPAVEVIASTNSDCQSQTNEVNIISLSVPDNNSMKNNHESKFMEQEGTQVLDTYDYERQRAKLKEIAAQRAKQRGKEEEERAREQMAKAQAKLEELEKRTKSNSASIEVDEHATAVLTDEVAKRKTKKRLTSSRGPSTDILMHDSENQYIDEASTQDFSNCTAPIPPIVDKKEAANNEESVSYPPRNKGEGFEKSSLNVVEDFGVREPLSGTRSGRGQRRALRGDLWLAQEGLLSVHDTEANFCSNEKYGVKKDEAENNVRRQKHKRGSRNQVREVASNYEIEKKAVARAIDEHDELKLLPAVQSQFTGRGWSLQSNAEEIRKPKVAELLASEKEPLAFSASERNSRLLLSSTHSHESARERLPKRGGKLEANFTVEQVGSSEPEQLVEPISGSGVDLLSEKLGQLHVSWRQKDPHGHQSDKTNIYVKNDRLSALEETLNAPAPSRKPWEKKKSGKQSSHGQQGLVELEGYVMDERNTNINGPMDFESTELNATFDLNFEAEVNAIEHPKNGTSCKSWWREKNGKNGGRISKSNVKNSGHFGVTDEACQEISDPIVPYTLASSRNSYTHNSRNSVKHSPKAAYQKSQRNNNHPVKPTSDSASFYEQQAGSQTAFEEDTVVYAACQSLKCENNEQEAKSVFVNRSRKRGSRAEVKLPVVTTHYEHQDMHSMELAEVVSDLSIKNRLNYETHRTSLQAFSPRNQHHEAEIEHREEQRPFNRGNRVRRPSNKANRQRQFNGCSTAAEHDRRDGETAIKSGISY